MTRLAAPLALGRRGLLSGLILIAVARRRPVPGRGADDVSDDPIKLLIVGHSGYPGRGDISNPVENVCAKRAREGGVFSLQAPRLLVDGLSGSFLQEMADREAEVIQNLLIEVHCPHKTPRPILLNPSSLAASPVSVALARTGPARRGIVLHPDLMDDVCEPGEANDPVRLRSANARRHVPVEHPAKRARRALEAADFNGRATRDRRNPVMGGFRLAKPRSKAVAYVMIGL